MRVNRKQTSDASRRENAKTCQRCVGWAKRSVPTIQDERRIGGHGAIALLPTLVWGCGSQEVGIAATSFFGEHVSFLVRPRVFLRPDHDARGAPRAAVVKAGRHCAGATGSIASRPRLDDGEPGARLDGRDDRSRDRRRDVMLDWAANDACGKHRITLYSVRDESPGPQSFMHGRRQGPERRDPSTKRA
jgi:hypothetical protein